jgi:hypothetical protein
VLDNNIRNFMCVKCCRFLQLKVVSGRIIRPGGRIIRPLWRVAEKRLRTGLDVNQNRGRNIRPGSRIIRPPGKSSNLAKDQPRCHPEQGPDIPARGPDNSPPSTTSENRLRTCVGVNQKWGADNPARGPDNPASRIIRPYFGRIIRPSKSATATFLEGL